MVLHERVLRPPGAVLEADCYRHIVYLSGLVDLAPPNLFLGLAYSDDLRREFQAKCL